MIAHLSYSQFHTYTSCPRSWYLGKRVKAEEKPSYEKLIDLSVVQAALGKAGGRLTGDKRWD